MNLIRFFGVGKTRLRRGSHARVLLVMETAPDTLEEFSNRHALQSKMAISFINLTSGEMRSSFLNHAGTETPKDGFYVDSYRAEISTSQFTEGAYEMKVSTTDRTTRNAEEGLWVLDAPSYVQLVSEAAQVVQDEQPVRITTKELEAVLNAILQESFSGFLSLHGQLLLAPRMDITLRQAGEVPPLPLDLITYVTHLMAVEFRQACLFGATVNCGLQIDGNKYTLSFDAGQTVGLSPALAESFNDPGTNELLMLEKFLREKDVEVRAGANVETAQIAASVVFNAKQALVARR